VTGLVTDAELAELEGRVERALVTGDAGSLRILGYGEITLVLGWPDAEPRVAAKRLPVFADASRAAAYGSLVGEYVARLADSGIDVLPTQWHTVPTADGRVAGYVVQEVLPAGTLAPRLLSEQPHLGEEVLTAVLDAVGATVGPDCGLDAQISNWAWSDGSLRYFDVTTPMLSDGAGRTRLDLGLLTSPLPAAARPLVARYVAPGIVGAYHDLRGVVVDLVGNLLKERLDGLLDTAIALGNERVTPAITRTEIDRWYATDARMWEVLLRLRRADRWWQRRVRRRTYPFLLPGAIER
jgi:hypothetical protein